MESITIAFIFEVWEGTYPLNASLEITDSNVFAIAGGQVQIQPAFPVAGATTPPLSFLNVGAGGLNLLAGPNPSSAAQGIEVVVPVLTSGNTLSLKFDYAQGEVNGFYQFAGSSRAALQIGSNVIAFPVLA
ncbi:hypothetical protein ACO0LM_01555 [Undibacterium sp. Di26W]|uniref:hypothetical protein n=1 Tax=Undibacterium sp. Di26W TaxID=3413035 RepID=UPI003BF2F6B3